MNRCPDCPTTKTCVRSDGPAPARIMLIGERPGKDEDREGIPFVGKSGRELNETYLSLAGIDRSDVYVTNTVKCGADNNKKPTKKEVEFCGGYHLPFEVFEVQPEFILLLGSTACSLIPSIDLERDHGLPIEGELFGWNCKIIPMYHPAAGMHSTRLMTPIIEDFKRLKEIVRGTWKAPVDDYDSKYFDEIWLEPFENCFPGALWGMDMETHGVDPWSIQVSIQPGSGVLIKADDKQSMEFLQSAINTIKPVICLHNAPGDLEVFSKLGLKITNYRDTMQEAYRLGLPQKLKVLGHRLLGVTMQSWEDLVLPYSKLAVFDWLEQQIKTEKTRPIAETKVLKTKTKIIEKPNQMEKVLTRVLKFGRSNPDYDMWSKLSESGIYGCPVKGIGNVPIKLAIDYACRDADITLRLAMKLDEIRQGKFEIGEGDIDDYARS